MVTELTKENFEEEVTNSEIPVIIDFWAGWCMPCRVLGPIFEELSHEYDGKVKFCKANIEEEGEMASFFKVSSIPTMAIVHEKQVREKILGAHKKEFLRNKIDEIIKKLK